MSTLYMFRHGQASFGHENDDQLSPIGYRQVGIVARHLRGLGIQFDAAYTGELARQKQAFQAMADAFTDADLPLPAPVTMPDLNEYDSEGVWQQFYPKLVQENKPLEIDETRMAQDPKAFQKIFARIIHRWVKGEDAQPDIESWQAFRTRITSSLNHIIRHEGSGKNVMIFSSAGPIAVAAQLATEMPDERCIGLSWQVMNASISRFRYNAKALTLVGFNDVSALELQSGPDLLTYR